MNFGDYKIQVIPDSEFRLDGGAMFGIVPRVVWERVLPPDKLNRIPLNMNCLFVETPAEKILIETGIGEKWSPEKASRFGIFREKSFSQSLFEITGYSPEDITIVVNTHLHFDHAGGNTISGESTPVPQFPNARHLVSESELAAAENPSDRDRASYLPENWRPLVETGQLELMSDDYEVVDGLTMQTVRGHSATMQTLRLERGDRILYGFADLIPTTAHLPPAWVMGYDLFPTETVEAKKDLLSRAVLEDWICLFYHDSTVPLARISTRDGRFFATPV